MCSFAKRPATYKGRLLPAAPRTDPYEPNSGIRLLPRVSDGKALLRPRKKDFRLRKPVISDLLHPLSHFLLDLLELAPHAVSPGFPLEEEFAMTGTSADVSKA